MKATKRIQQKKINLKLGVSMNYTRWGKVLKNQNFTSSTNVQ